MARAREEVGACRPHGKRGRKRAQNCGERDSALVDGLPHKQLTSGPCLCCHLGLEEFTLFEPFKPMAQLDHTSEPRT